MTIETERLLLIPATLKHIQAELKTNGELGQMLSAEIPVNWPPEELKDALPYFLSVIEKDGESAEWLCRYCLLKGNANDGPVLIGSIGFFNKPDKDGFLETGYSVLSQYQGNGYATEMLMGIINWACNNGVNKIIARTDNDNIKSQKVLLKADFQFSGDILEEKKKLFVYCKN